jgi:hypothetical protein
MSDHHEIGDEIVEALKARIQRRIHERVEAGTQGMTADSLLQAAIRDEATELTQQETLCRERGENAAADAFQMVRAELLGSLAGQMSIPVRA